MVNIYLKSVNYDKSYIFKYDTLSHFLLTSELPYLILDYFKIQKVLYAYSSLLIFIFKSSFTEFQNLRLEELDPILSKKGNRIR